MVVSKNKDKFLTNIVFCPRCSLRPAYGKIGVLSNLFPSLPVLALKGTATRVTKRGITGSLGLSDPVIFEFNPDRANIYYASHVRPDRGDEKLETILTPFILKLEVKRNQMPPTLVYGNLENTAECFLNFSNSMGEDQYYPFSAQPLARNRLFSPYHPHYPQHERNRIVEELVRGTYTQRVLFVTIAFGLGIDCNNIRHQETFHISLQHQTCNTHWSALHNEGLCMRHDGSTFSDPALPFKRLQPTYSKVPASNYQAGK